MRKQAIVSNPDAKYRRMMIHDPEDGRGVFLFLFRSLDEGPCQGDCWYENVAEAERDVVDLFGSEAAAWQIISDPEPGCQADRISSIHVVRDADDHPVA